jgi:hypothetical protein
MAIAYSPYPNLHQCNARMFEAAVKGIDNGGVQLPAIKNAEYVTAMNAAGTGVVNMIGVNSSNQAVLPVAVFPAAAGAINFSGLTPSTETSGSLVTTGSTWVAFSTAGACGMKLLLSGTCATGEFATVRFRARADNTTASGDGGNSVGTITCADLSASANTHEYGNLKALNACAQPNAKNQTVDATNIVTALYGRIDATGTSIGRRWVAWLDTHATTKAAAGDYMCRISHNGTVAIDGVFSVYAGGRLPVLFNFEDVGAGCPVTVTGADASGFYGRVACYAGGALRYVNLYTTSNA